MLRNSLLQGIIVIISVIFFQILSINIYNLFLYIGPGMGGGLVAEVWE